MVEYGFKYVEMQKTRWQSRLSRVFGSDLGLYLLFWLFILAFIMLTTGSKEGPISLATRFIFGLRVIVQVIVPVYVHLYLLERYFYRRRYGLYFVFLVATIVGFGYVNSYLVKWIFGGMQDWLATSIIIFFMIALSSVLKIMRDSTRQRFLLQEIQAKHVETELDLLKTQIHPHFLFNTLNNLFGMARKGDAATADGIARLSHLMRYMIYDSRVDKIDLDKEIDQIQRLIELHKLRFAAEDDIAIDFKIEGKTKDICIPPMLLIPFVENAFKHGISLKQPSFVRMALAAGAGSLHFSVENSVHPRTRDDEDPVEGMGLQNVKRRLELLYPDSHELAVRITDTSYAVELRIENV
jgi:sensor histidine kinase YesM